MSLTKFCVAYDDIVQAAGRIKDHAVLTPLIENEQLNKDLNARVFIKAESLQRTGSFKFRGAYNSLSLLSAQGQLDHGVVAYSSGNHAQGIAAAALLFGTKARIVMPEDAPLIKQQRTKDYGAEIILYNRYTQSREQIGQDICKQSQAALIPPYDYAPVIAGQGTVGLEIAQVLKSKKITPELAIIGCGGGGLIAGSSLALKHHFPGLNIYACEPETHDDMRRSLEAGERKKNPADAPASLCDAIVTPEPGVLTWPINKALLTADLAVSDQEALAAVAYAFTNLKLVVEPGGVVALAALLARKIDVSGKTVVITLTGGNIDPQVMIEALAYA